MSVQDTFLLGLTSFLSGSIGVTVGGFLMWRKVKREAPDMLLNLIDDITPELPKLMANENLKQFIYEVGLLVGNGAKQGLGLPGAGKGGKMKLSDLIMTGAMAFLGNKIPGLGALTGAAQPEQQPQQGSTW
jgi:hypothetical protein